MRRVQALIGAAMFSIAAVPKVEAQAIPLPVATCITNPVCLTVGIVVVGAYSYYLIQNADASPELYPADDESPDDLEPDMVIANNMKEGWAGCEKIAAEKGKILMNVVKHGNKYFCIFR